MMYVWDKYIVDINGSKFERKGEKLVVKDSEEERGIYRCVCVRAKMEIKIETYVERL